MTSTTKMKFLKTCFWLSIALFISQFLIFIGFVFGMPDLDLIMQHPITQTIYGIMTIALLLLFFYSLLFFFKYDRYSKSGIYFFFFHILYAIIYFYKVIWKKKRELVNSFESEPVLGNRIHIIEEPIEN
jgi:hypothetical protein